MWLETGKISLPIRGIQGLLQVTVQLEHPVSGRPSPGSSWETVLYQVCVIPRSATTKGHTPGGSKRNTYSLPPFLKAGVRPRCGFLQRPLSRVLTWLSLCVCVLISSLYKDPVTLDRGPPYDLLYLDHLCDDPLSKCSHMLRCQELCLQHRNLEGYNTAHDPRFLRTVDFIGRQEELMFLKPQKQVG